MNTRTLVRHLLSSGVKFRIVPGPTVRLQLIDLEHVSTREERRQLSAARLEVLAFLEEQESASAPTTICEPTPPSPTSPLDPEAATEFLEERSAIAEYDGQIPRNDAEAQANAELNAIQGTTPVGPIRCNAKLHMLTKGGTVTHDPAKCYQWTREVLGFGWWYASEFPPPLQ